MVWLCYFCLLLCGVAGLILVILTMPGLWLMTAVAAAYALVTHLRFLGGRSLILLFLLAVAGEVLEVVIMGREARRAGGRRGTGLGAFIGGFVGAILGSFIPIPIVGTILGLCLGCFAGAAIVEFKGGGEARKSIQVGVGAARGRAMGVGVKFIVGVVMLIVVFWEGFP